MTLMPPIRTFPAGAVRLDPCLAQVIPATAVFVMMRGHQMLTFTEPPEAVCPKKAKRWRIIRAQRRNEVVRLIRHRVRFSALSYEAQWAFAVAIASVFDHLEAAELLRGYCPALSDDDAEDILTEAAIHPFRWTAREFGRLVDLTKPERSLLDIRTFRAKGVSLDEMEADNRRKNAATQRAKRALNAKPKPVSLRAAEPWIVLGMSERTFYRLKRDGEIVVDVLPDGSTAVRHKRSGTIVLLTPVLPRAAAAPEGAAPIPSTKSRAGASSAQRTRRKAKSPTPMKANASSPGRAGPARGAEAGGEGASHRFFPAPAAHAARAAPPFGYVSDFAIPGSLRILPLAMAGANHLVSTGAYRPDFIWGSNNGA